MRCGRVDAHDGGLCCLIQLANCTFYVNNFTCVLEDALSMMENHKLLLPLDMYLDCHIIRYERGVGKFLCVFCVIKGRCTYLPTSTASKVLKRWHVLVL